MEILKAVSLIIIIILEIAVTPLESAVTEPDGLSDVRFEVKEASIIYPFEGSSSEAPLLKGKALPYGDKHGKKFSMTPKLYERARKAMGQIGKHAKFIASDGLQPLYRAQEPFHLDFEEDPPEDLNLVFCRGKPIDFYARQVADRKYILYYYNLEVDDVSDS